MVVQRGFDISHWEGAEDIRGMVSKYNLTFLGMKAYEAVEDPRFANYWAQAAATPVVRIAYDYPHPEKSVNDQADKFVAIVRSHGVRDTDLLCLDLEHSDGLNQSQVNAFAKAWARRVRDRMPDKVPGIYAGSGYMSSGTGRGLHSKDFYGWWWYPRYPGKYANTTSWPTTLEVSAPTVDWGGPPDIWQFTENFKVGGEDHDANIAFRDMREINDMAGLTADDKKFITDTTAAIEPWTYKGAGETEDMHAALKAAEAAAKAAQSGATDLKTKLDTLTGKVDQLAAGGLDPAVVAQMVFDKIKAQLSK